MNNDNDIPFEKLDIESLFNIRQWVRDAVEARGAKVVGSGIGIKGDLGMADIDFEIDGFLYNLEITPRSLTSHQRQPGPTHSTHASGSSAPAPAATPFAPSWPRNFAILRSTARRTEWGCGSRFGKALRGSPNAPHAET